MKRYDEMDLLLKCLQTKWTEYDINPLKTKLICFI
jgi:hypothetical protein